MIRLVYGDDFRVCAYIEHRLRQVFSPPYTTIGATADEAKTICGGALFNHWNGSNIEITLAVAPGVLNRRTIGAVYKYMFEHIGARRATAITRRSNILMRDLLPRLGFNAEPEGVLKQFYGPHKADDGFVFVLFPEQARKFL